MAALRPFARRLADERDAEMSARSRWETFLHTEGDIENARICDASSPAAIRRRIQVVVDFENVGGQIDHLNSIGVVPETIRPHNVLIKSAAE